MERNVRLTPFLSAFVNSSPTSYFMHLFQFIANFLFLCPFLLSFYPPSSIFVQLFPFLSALLTFYASSSIFVQLSRFMSIFLPFCPPLLIYQLFSVHLTPFLSIFITFCPIFSFYVRFTLFLCLRSSISVKLSLF